MIKRKEGMMVKKAILQLIFVVVWVGQSMAAPPSVGLHEAAMNGDLKAIAQHIEAGSDLNEQDPMSGATPMIIATVFGKVDAVKALIEGGADINYKNKEGATPLIVAAVFNQVDVSSVLMDAGADLNAKNNDGSTALITASLLCRTEIVEKLLRHGADKSLTNNAGRTALDAVADPFEKSKDTYDYLNAVVFGPLGVQLDYERLKATRPKIAEMLK
jgi:hypothetical protein